MLSDSRMLFAAPCFVCGTTKQQPFWVSATSEGTIRNSAERKPDLLAPTPGVLLATNCPSLLHLFRFSAKILHLHITATKCQTLTTSTASRELRSNLEKDYLFD